MAVTKVEEAEVAAPLVLDEGGEAISGDAVATSITKLIPSCSSILGVLRRERWEAPLSPNWHHPT